MNNLRSIFEVNFQKQTRQDVLIDLMLGSGQDGKEELKDGSILYLTNQAGGCSIAGGKTELGHGQGVKSLTVDMLTWRHALALSGQERSGTRTLVMVSLPGSRRGAFSAQVSAELHLRRWEPELRRFCVSCQSRVSYGSFNISKRRASDQIYKFTVFLNHQGTFH